MPEIDDVCRQLWEATEFVAIVTQGPEGPHVVGNWGDYVRKLGLRDGVIVMPAGKYRRASSIPASPGPTTCRPGRRHRNGCPAPGTTITTTSSTSTSTP